MECAEASKKRLEVEQCARVEAEEALHKSKELDRLDALMEKLGEARERAEKPQIAKARFRGCRIFYVLHPASHRSHVAPQDKTPLLRWVLQTQSCTASKYELEASKDKVQAANERHKKTMRHT